MSRNFCFYTFNAWHNTTYKVGKLLLADGYPVYFLNNTPTKQIATMCARHSYMIGLGDSSISARRLRVESICQNLYGKKKIIEQGKATYELFHDFQLDQNMYCAVAATNGKCNRAAYLVASNIPDSKNSAFIHVPKKIDLEMITAKMNSLGEAFLLKR